MPSLPQWIVTFASGVAAVLAAVFGPAIGVDAQTAIIAGATLVVAVQLRESHATRRSATESASKIHVARLQNPVVPPAPTPYVAPQAMASATKIVIPPVVLPQANMPATPPGAPAV